MGERLLLQTPRATAAIRCAGALLLALVSAGCAGSTSPSGDGQLADGVAPFDSDTSSDGDTRFDGAGDGAVTEGGSLDAGADAAPGCEAGALRCGAECVSAAQTQTDPLRCGASCAVCPAGPASSHPVCAAGACDFECDAGFMRLGARCERARVVLLAPHSGYRQTSARPGFRFRLPPRTTRATVEVCADRACATVEQSADVSARSEWTPPAVLSRGRHFWRVRATTDAGELVPAALPFYTPRFERPVNAESLLLFDFDGDGRTDFLERYGSPVSRGVVALSSGDGFGITTRTIEIQPASIPTGCEVRETFATLPAGDLNADGYGDIALTIQLSCAGSYVMALGVALGGSSGLGAVSAAIETTDGGIFRGAIPDFNDDGFSDILLLHSSGDRSTLSAILFNATGRHSEEIPLDIEFPSMPLATTSTGFPDLPYVVGDVNADGYFDMLRVLGSFASSCGGTPPVNTNSMQFYRGRPSGFLAPTEITFDAPTFVHSLAPAGDLNGDGFPDIVSRSRSRNFLALGGRSQLSLLPFYTSDRGHVLGRDHAIPLGDVDDDGYDDWALGASFTTYGTPLLGSQWLDLYRGGESLPISPTTTINFYDGSFFFSLGALGVRGLSSMDVNGDGIFDVLVTGNMHDLRVGLGMHGSLPNLLNQYDLPRPAANTDVSLDSMAGCGWVL